MLTFSPSEMESPSVAARKRATAQIISSQSVNVMVPVMTTLSEPFVSALNLTLTATRMASPSVAKIRVVLPS